MAENYCMRSCSVPSQKTMAMGYFFKYSLPPLSHHEKNDRWKERQKEQVPTKFFWKNWMTYLHLIRCMCLDFGLVLSLILIIMSKEIVLSFTCWWKVNSTFYKCYLHLGWDIMFTNFCQFHLCLPSSPCSPWPLFQIFLKFLSATTSILLYILPMEV